MRTKVCFKCGKQKSAVEFYAHPRMADGRIGKCKSCTKADVRENRGARREQYSAYERERNQRPERRESSKRHMRERARRTPEKFAARQAVSNAVRDGRLRRMPCEVCGSMRVQAHHEDYSKPLEVRWLCWTHHREAHGHVVVVPNEAAPGGLAA